ncbi:MAG: hypothetical protein HQL76_09390 [Magnetococcales bacterium]|nr:hypothetical protein [Magnetococcales bacterium]
MNPEWFKRSSLTFRESAWILLGIDPDDTGAENRKNPTTPLRPGSVSDGVERHFSPYLEHLDLLFRAVARGNLPLTREPWNRFPHCFVRIHHLASWALEKTPNSPVRWSDHGIVPEPLPPPPRDWIGWPEEHPLLTRMRQQLVDRAAIRKLSPLMKDEMTRLLQWASTQETGTQLPAMEVIKDTLRPLYKTLRNLPVLDV